MKFTLMFITFIIGGMLFADVETAAIAHIKSEEGFSSCWYTCQAGQRTIGYGFSSYILTSDEKRMPFMSKTVAEAILLREVRKIRKELNKDVKFLSLTEKQEVALISMAWNMGVKRFRKTDLYQKICMRSSPATVAAEIRKYSTYTDPKTKKRIQSKGLVKRRAREALMWLGC